MRLTIALVASLIVPVQAFALSCMPASVEFSYAAAANSKETYRIVTGKLTFDKTLLPRSTVGLEKPEQLTTIPAKISGKAFSGEGFDRDFETDVNLIVRCLGSWCPVISKDQEHLMFLKETETTYELALDPCGGAAFSEPSSEILGQVSACFKDGNCTTER